MFPLIFAALMPLMFLASALIGRLIQVDWADFRSVLIWLAGVGSPYVVGYIVSLLAENWPQWHNLPRWVKFLVPMLVSVALSAGATMLLQYEDIIGIVGPWWTLIIGAILAYLGTQVSYMNSKRAGYGYGPKMAEATYRKEIDKMTR